MNIIVIKKKTIISLALTVLIVAFSFAYTRVFRENALRVFMNNEGDMPIYSVEIPDKRMAITFDTGWGDQQHVQDILYVLKRYDIKATFFIVGSWADKYPDMVKSINSEGHELGNHSTTHLKMTDLSRNTVLSEIRDTDQKIKQITGKSAILFRAPFGEYNSTVLSAASELKYKSIKWDIDSFDWKGISKDAIKSRVTEKAGEGSIILFHCNADNTPDALPDIIEKFRKDGYKFVTVSQLLFNENYYIDNTGRQKPLK